MSMILRGRFFSLASLFPAILLLVAVGKFCRKTFRKYQNSSAPELANTIVV